MTNEQVGCYIRLLCIQHQKGSLTERDIMQVCGSRDEDIFAKFVMQADGSYINIRLAEEAKRRKDYAESRRKNISKRYEKNMNNISNTYESTYVEHMETETETETVTVTKTINEDKTENKKPKFSFKLAMQQFGFDDKLIDEWMLVRRIKRISNSETAFYNFVNEVKKINIDKNELLKLIITKSWGGFKSDWYYNQTNINTDKNLGPTASFHHIDYAKQNKL